MAKPNMVYNPPPNWPVGKGFTPPDGWQPDPAWGPPPQGWPLWTEKKKHTLRNVILGLVVIVILGAVGCTALLAGGVNSAVKSNQDTASKNAAANAQTCAGKTYPDQQKDNDHCADASGQVTLDNVAVVATPVQRDAQQNVCTTVNYTNHGDKTVSFNMIDWKIQSPTGEVQNNVFSGSGDLGSGQLIKDGKKSGSVCFSPIKGSGAFVLIYKPSFLNDERAVWLNQVK
jgi:hypothetical protein